jgi:hypothetical protein
MSGPISEARGRVNDETVKNGRSGRDYLWTYWVNRIDAFCFAKELPDCKDPRKPYKELVKYDVLEELREHLYALELYWNDNEAIFGADAAGSSLNTNSFLATIPPGANVDATMEARAALAWADINRAYTTLLANYGSSIKENSWSQGDHNFPRYTALYNGGLAELCNQLVQNIYKKYADALQRQKEVKGIPTPASQAAAAEAAERAAEYAPKLEKYREELKIWKEKMYRYNENLRVFKSNLYNRFKEPPPPPPKPTLPPMPGQAVQNLGVQGGGRTRRCTRSGGPCHVRPCRSGLCGCDV